ncbi:hypothetical protein FOZ61_005421 [Perkinsus olseni]|uniref:Uncharacterized protein n=1 Tax=Perkinsus olseni TaxID=32597 RepID=A0A7J6MI00_PEROL|nr:hypothetical protein FOZ61_005421 [Perkinsus olseni]
MTAFLSVLHLVALCNAAEDLRVSKTTNQSVHWKLLNAIQAAGPCCSSYLRPSGGCLYTRTTRQLSDCACGVGGAHLLDYPTDDNSNRYIVCSNGCNGVSCPAPPGGTSRCATVSMDGESYDYCFLRCSGDGDCINGGTCANVQGYKVCMYLATPK